MIHYLAEARVLEPEILAIRRDIHAHPEMGNEEFRTAALIERVLNEHGVETRRVLDTGVIGILQGAKPGRTVAFRADIDALPVQENTNLEYASEVDGRMHACGHDIHTASLLGTAMLLASHRDEIEGTVVFVFQPDEEGDGGAERILESGILDELNVSVIYGAHTAPELPAGTIGVKYGRFYASAEKFDVVVRGQGTHGAEPENGTDSLYAAARMCAELKGLTGYVEDPGAGDQDEVKSERVVCTVGKFRAGEARNIISDHAIFQGILRTAGPELREQMKSSIYEIVDRIAQEVGVEYEMNLDDGYIGVTNHDADTQLVREVSAELLGEDHVVVEEDALMTTEDFGFYLEKYKGAYYHIGVGSEFPLHSPFFNPKESAVAVASAVHAAVLMRALEK